MCVIGSCGGGGLVVLRKLNNCTVGLLSYTIHAIIGNMMLARLYTMPKHICSRVRYLALWNSEMYDVRTANGPLILQKIALTQVITNKVKHKHETA